MSLILTTEEITSITGYRQAAKQVLELRRQGYYRARRCPRTGIVILERAHYLAVNAGTAAPAPAESRREPQVRVPKVRPAKGVPA